MPTQDSKKQKKASRRPLSEMQKKRRNRLQKQIRFAVIAVVLAAIIGGALYFLLNRDENRISVIENGVGSIVAMVQNAVSGGVDTAKDAVVDIMNYGDMKQEMEDLRRENDTLRIQLQDAKQAADENERLQRQLDAKNQYTPLDPIYARVISRTPGPWFDTFSINRGTLDNVDVGMAVITADGLVGRIYEAGLNYAKVLSIIDSRSAVAMLVERTRDNGILRGVVTSASETAECFVYYLPNVNSIIPGDTVITSGMDTIYPKGIPIGIVTEVSREVDSANQYVVVQPYVDFAHIEDVLVIRERVESDNAELPAVPDPTRVPMHTYTPAPTDAQGNVIGGEQKEEDSDIYIRPTMPPMDSWDAPAATVQPIETIPPVDMSIPEDRWANE